MICKKVDLVTQGYFDRFRYVCPVHRYQFEAAKYLLLKKSLFSGCLVREIIDSIFVYYGRLA